MSYVVNPDLPDEVYWSRGSLYDSVRSLKGYMTEQLGRYVAQENRRRGKSSELYDPAGIDFSDFKPRRIYQLTNMDGKSVVQWDDITDQIMEDRINHMRSKYA